MVNYLFLIAASSSDGFSGSLYDCISMLHTCSVYRTGFYMKIKQGCNSKSYKSALFDSGHVSHYANGLKYDAVFYLKIYIRL